MRPICVPPAVRRDHVIMDVIMDVIMVYNGVIMGIRDTLFAIITFVIMVYNGVIMETRFADGGRGGGASLPPGIMIIGGARGARLGLTTASGSLGPAFRIQVGTLATGP